MGTKEDHKNITAIVPAYNEGDRIERVLDILVSYPSFCEIIVVDDGSTDNTEEIVKKYPVHYLKNMTNQGKGQAMDAGIKAARSKVIFFVDADVSGLTHAIIDEITKPVISGDLDMFIGMRNRKIYYLHKLIVFVPLLGGERAITKTLWQSMPSYYKHRFRVEAGLNFYSRYYGKGFKYKVFKGLSQVIKEKKYGLISGLKQRIAMFINIFSAQFKLELTDIPESVKNKRLLAFIALQSLIGLLLGGIILAAVYYGPNNFILRVFADELKEDPDAPFVHYLLYLSNVTAVSTFMVAGGLILVTNLFTFVLTFKKLKYLFGIVSNKINSQKQ